MVGMMGMFRVNFGGSGTYFMGLHVMHGMLRLIMTLMPGMFVMHRVIHELRFLALVRCVDIMLLMFVFGITHNKLLWLMPL
jgi:hypothetical protein